ncbi:MAG: protein translocase subunit SecF [Bryobacteraceae bacterium]|jgi:preprotein translocase subunit SecF
MEIFKQTNFDFLGNKWPFIIGSVVLSVAGLVSLGLKGGPRYGIDFRGGAMMDVKFAGPPPADKIRSALSQRISGGILVQNVGGADNEVLIGTELKSEQELAAARAAMTQTLETAFGGPEAGQGKLDFNNAGRQVLIGRLRDPLIRAGVASSEAQVTEAVDAMVTFRDRERSGLVTRFEDLASSAGVSSKILDVVKQECFLGQFAVRRVEIVGPKVGAELRLQAVLATLYALGGMLVYIAVRFEWIYGLAAVIAVFHDTIITIGLFSLLNKEVSLTVIAALLTLVGYSMNDTIVVFDRIRENLKILRREKLAALINLSINQTLSRTVLTSGLTFLTVLALFLFGGAVLHGFSFALVIGILIGTYSSIFVASPILVFWQSSVERRKRPPAMPAAPAPGAAGRRGSAKAVK